MFANPTCKEIFCNLQPRPALVQLEPISSHSVTLLLDSHPTTASIQVLVEDDMVSPPAPFLQTKQPQLPQLFLLRLVL